ncbi:hypothetical protein [Streptomyces virginiae]|uniref:hypothetical protein n=1 Tax=Streptomyces virginiae TaxID=1961 RepID=UPI00131C41D5|nr:hypothetical protein [Streptomyces virginiae]
MRNSFNEDRIIQILEEMTLNGGELTIGSYRSHISYRWEDGTWVFEEFDEGFSQTGATSEAAVRDAIQAHPNESGRLVHAIHLRECALAWAAEDWAAAFDAATLATENSPADSFEQACGRLLRAVAGFPQHDLRPDTLAAITRAGYGVNHAIYNLFPNEISPRVARIGIAYVQKLIEITETQTDELTVSLRAFQQMLENAKDREAAEVLS